MIIKTIGEKLLIDTKLYILLYKLSPIFILLSPWLFVFFNRFQEANKFQEPTLRTKIYELSSWTKMAEKNNNTTALSKFNDNFNGIVWHKINGLYEGEFLAITFPYINSNIDEIKSNQFLNRLIDHIALILQKENKKTPFAKDILLIGYQDSNALDRFLYDLQTSPLGQLHGVIRAGINLDIKSEANMIYYKIYGNNGRKCDTDYYFSIEELLVQLQIKFKPCEQKIQWFKALSKFVRINLSVNLDYLSEFIHGQVCSISSKEQQGHKILLDHGIQSSTLKGKRLTKSNNEAIPIQKYAKLIFSWLSQFNMQQENLHSANTLWQWMGNNYFISVKFSIIPYVCFLAFVLINIIYRYFMNTVTLQIRLLDLVFLNYLALGITFLEKIKGFHFYGAIAILILGKIVNWKSKKEIEDYRQIILSAISVLISVYFCIYHLAWSFIGSFITILILLPKKLTILIITAILLLFFSNYNLNWNKNEWLQTQMYSDISIGRIIFIPLAMWLLS